MEATQEAILKIVLELKQMVFEDLPLDHHIHAHISGVYSKGIHKITDEFKVDIHFLQSGNLDPNYVTMKGLPENVEEAIDNILNLEEKYLSNVWTMRLCRCI